MLNAGKTKRGLLKDEALWRDIERFILDEDEIISPLQVEEDDDEAASLSPIEETEEKMRFQQNVYSKVINCATLSVLRICEMDPAAAMATNVPSTLVKWLSIFGKSGSLLIHLSTDQGGEIIKMYWSSCLGYTLL
ncbi:hypothetical protein NE237_001182 [Protea cynaroides]|uniref:Uncharacterized protein n=1 Tax=Protea cynaroides TaxID=273540 RepID=A0A9Q0KSU3_9MAGN|nr:hypothetical protein NE237_001182 [Protea cynaroides]